MKRLKHEIDTLWQKADKLSDKDFHKLETMNLLLDLNQVSFDLSEHEKELIESQINKATLEQIDSLTFLNTLELEENTTLHKIRMCLTGELGEIASLETWDYLCTTFTSFENKVIELLG